MVKVRFFSGSVNGLSEVTSPCVTLLWWQRKGLKFVALFNSVPLMSWCGWGVSRRRLEAERSGSRGGCAGIGSAWWTKPLSTTGGSFTCSSELQVLWLGAERQLQWAQYVAGSQGEAGTEPSRAPWGPSCSCWSRSRNAKCSTAAPTKSGPGEESVDLFQSPVRSHQLLPCPYFPLLWGWGILSLCFPMYHRPSTGAVSILPLGNHTGCCLQEVFLVVLWWIPLWG